MWANQQLKETWENLEDVAYRLRRGNTHYHNVVEVLASLQIALTLLDKHESRIDALKDELLWLKH